MLAIGVCLVLKFLGALKNNRKEPAVSERPTPAMFTRISHKPVAVIHHVARLTGEAPCVDIAAAVNGRTIFLAAEPVRDDADVHRVLLNALKRVWALADGGLAVYGLPVELREVAQLDPEFRGIEFPATTTGRLRGTWDACRASFAAMQETLYARPAPEKAPAAPVHLTIATDASKQKCSNVVGIAAVSTSGRITTAKVNSSKVLEGEFAAIELALSTVRGNVASVEVLTDSQKAARYLNIVLDGALTQRPGSGPEEVKCLRRLARVRRNGVAISVRWVRGHNGHPLNELAHRSAVTARRNAQWELEESPQIVHLREELRQVVAAGSSACRSSQSTSSLV